ncbi:MAG: hypothetical protein IJF49_03490 [Clostridia bacterium]|nr:hypothetical protein [Clostridia bacterium]
MTGKTRKIALLGGDRRQLAAARRLEECGNEVIVWGLPKHLAQSAKIIHASDWESAVNDADVIVLPLPVTHDGIRINCALLEQTVSPREISELRFTHIIDAIGTDKRIFGGKIPPACKTYAEEHGITMTDYSENELFQLRNAKPTAEGALEIALHELPITLSGTSAAVIGYGRIAHVLASLLSAVGVKVTVAARKASDLCCAELQGFQSLRIAFEKGISTLTKLDASCRVIFNTVPYWLFDQTVLSVLNPNTLIIDLASAPGGVDPQAAANCGIRVIRAPGLPGKCAPDTAGEIIADTVLALLTQEGGNEA